MSNELPIGLDIREISQSLGLDRERLLDFISTMETSTAPNNQSIRPNNTPRELSSYPSLSPRSERFRLSRLARHPGTRGLQHSFRGHM